MPDDFRGGLIVQVLREDSSPNAYDNLEKCFSLTGFGETAGTIKTTNFDSDAHEYISDLADGNEFSANCNRVHLSPSCQDYLQGKVGSQVTMRLTLAKNDESPAPVRRADFAVRVTGTEDDPQVEDKNMISFNFKITGGITRSNSFGT